MRYTSQNHQPSHTHIKSCPGQWPRAAEAYRTLSQLASAYPDAAVRSRTHQFIRRQGDSAAKAGSNEDAEACFLQLLDETDLGEWISVCLRHVSIEKDEATE